MHTIEEFGCQCIPMALGLFSIARMSKNIAIYIGWKVIISATVCGQVIQKQNNNAHLMSI